MKQSTPDKRPFDAVEKDLHTLSFFIQDMLQTQEARQVLGFLIPEALQTWAGNNWLKRMIARPVGAVISNGFCPEQDGHYPSLAEDPHLVQQMGKAVPALFAVCFQAIHSMGDTVDILTVEEKKKLLGDVISGISGGRSGKAVTVLTRILNEIHEKDSEFLTRAVEPGFRKWIEDTDFGELRDFMDHSADGLSTLAEMVNDVMWQYPAKLVLTLSFLPDIFNVLLITANETIGRFNQSAPDMVADIILSLLRQINGRAIGQCVNEITELTRKIHTGSALIGEPGSPQFPQDVSRLIEEAAECVHGDILAKARVALAEYKGEIAKAVTDAKKTNPELWMEQIKRYAGVKNPGFRSNSYRLSALEELPREDLADAVSEGMSDLEIQEVGEIVNLTSMLFNRIRGLRPDLVKSLMTQFADSLDPFEFQEAVQGMFADMTDTMWPVGRVVLPEMVKAVCGIMEPEDDEYEDNMAEARSMLRSLLIGEEVRS